MILVEEGLQSGDPDKVLNALWRLGGIGHTQPPCRVLELAVGQFESSDADIRTQAIFAAVIHWGYQPAFERVVTIIQHDPEDEVVDVACSGISRLARQRAALIVPTLQALETVCSNQQRSLQQRQRALWLARWAVGELTAREYARGTSDTQDAEPDLGWFTKNIAERDMTQYALFVGTQNVDGQIVSRAWFLAFELINCIADTTLLHTRLSLAEIHTLGIPGEIALGERPDSSMDVNSIWLKHVDRTLERLAGCSVDPFSGFTHIDSYKNGRCIASFVARDDENFVMLSGVTLLEIEQAGFSVVTCASDHDAFVNCGYVLDELAEGEPWVPARIDRVQ